MVEMIQVKIAIINVFMNIFRKFRILVSVNSLTDIKNAFGFAFAAIFFVGCTDVESINDVDLNQTRCV